MNFCEQGTINSDRYVIVPRTLTFLIRQNQVLLLRGATDKRIWANRLNGIGGHVEPYENVRESAIREFKEETGMELLEPQLRGIVHIQGHRNAPGVVLYVFVSNHARGTLVPSTEGTLEWHSLDRLPHDELVEDVAELLPRITDSTKDLVYGHYQSDLDGTMHFRFA